METDNNDRKYLVLKYVIPYLKTPLLIYLDKDIKCSALKKTIYHAIDIPQEKEKIKELMTNINNLRKNCLYTIHYVARPAGIIDIAKKFPENITIEFFKIMYRSISDDPAPETLDELQSYLIKIQPETLKEKLQEVFDLKLWVNLELVNVLERYIKEFLKAKKFSHGCCWTCMGIGYLRYALFLVEYKNLYKKMVEMYGKEIFII